MLNIGILIVFKYTNFLLKTGYSILDLFGIGHGDDLFKLIMPLGISFFTFQILSYLIDVYKGKVKAQKNFLKYLLYISFFPSVVQDRSRVMQILAHSCTKSIVLSMITSGTEHF